MSVVVDLPHDTESKLREHAAQHGKDLAEYLRGLVESWAEANGRDTTSSHVPNQEDARWLAEWRSWASNPPTTAPMADDSRESVYGGRGE